MLDIKYLQVILVSRKGQFFGQFFYLQYAQNETRNMSISNISTLDNSTSQLRHLVKIFQNKYIFYEN